MPSSLSNISAILFDKDGTLIDFNRTWFEIAMALARDARPGDPQAANALMAQGGYDWEQQRFVGGSVVAAGTIAELVDLWHPTLEHADRRERIARYDDFALDRSARSAAGIMGVEAALEALAGRGFQLGIATNDSEAGARAMADALGLTDRFEAIIGYDSVLRPKPHPDQLLLFSRVTGIDPGAIAMVGDNSHDLEMAHAAGAGLAIGVLSGNSTRAELEALADIIIDSVADLPTLFA